MKIVTEKEATSAFRRLADTACDNHEPVCIAREDGKPVVLISLEDYELADETEHLLRSPANAYRLLKSINDLRSGIPATERSLVEP